MSEMELKITADDAAASWQRRDLIKRLPGDNQLSEKLDVDIKGTKMRREVHWGTSAALVKYDDNDEVDDLLDAVGDLIDVAAQASTYAAAGMPTAPRSLLGLVKQTITGFDHLSQVFSSKRSVVELAAVRLPVKIENRLGRTVKLRGTVMVRANWLTDEPDDMPWSSTAGDGNFAWFEAELFSLRTGHECAPAGEFKIERPWAGHSANLAAHLRKPLHEQNVPGRSFMLPVSDDDAFGYFPEVVHSCETTVGEDEFEVNFSISMNAIADDLMVVFCREVVLVLEIELLEEKKPGTGLELDDDEGDGSGEEEDGSGDEDDKEPKGEPVSGNPVRKAAIGAGLGSGVEKRKARKVAAHNAREPRHPRSG